MTAQAINKLMAEIQPVTAPVSPSTLREAAQSLEDVATPIPAGTVRDHLVRILRHAADAVDTLTHAQQEAEQTIRTLQAELMDGLRAQQQARTVLLDQVLAIVDDHCGLEYPDLHLAIAALRDSPEEIL